MRIVRVGFEADLTTGEQVGRRGRRVVEYTMSAEQNDRVIDGMVKKR